MKESELTEKQVVITGRQDHAEDIVVDSDQTYEVNYLRTTSHREGPLPSAAEFAEYERACPGTAKELLAIAKAEMEHRHKCELEIIRIEEKKLDKENNELKMSASSGKANVEIAARGQITSFLVLVVLIVFVYLSSIKGAFWTAGLLFVILFVFSFIVAYGAVAPTVKTKYMPEEKNEVSTRSDDETE